MVSYLPSMPWRMRQRSFPRQDVRIWFRWVLPQKNTTASSWKRIRYDLIRGRSQSRTELVLFRGRYCSDRSITRSWCIFQDAFLLPSTCYGICVSALNFAAWRKWRILFRGSAAAVLPLLSLGSWNYPVPYVTWRKELVLRVRFFFCIQKRKDSRRFSW